MSNFNSIAEGDVRVIELSDTQLLDESYCHSVSRSLTEIVNTMNESALVINMSKVKFMASAMIGKLVLLRNRCKQKGIEFAVCDLNDNVLSAIQLMRIDKILTVHPTQQQAVDAMQS